MPRPPFGLTREQAHAWFEQNGINMAEWCRHYQISRYIVIDLLLGKLRGRRGQAHRAAILLGLKADPEKLAA